MNLLAEYDVSSSNRSGDMEGGPKISKVGHWPHPDPLWPNYAFLSLVPVREI